MKKAAAFFTDHRDRRQPRKLHGGRFRRNVPSKPTSPIGFVAYSSLPVGCFHSCGHARKPCADKELLETPRASSNNKEYAACGIDCKPIDGKDKTATAGHSCRKASPLFSTSSEDQSKDARNSPRRPGTAVSKGLKTGVEGLLGLIKRASPSIPGSSANEPSTLNSFGSSQGTRSPSPLKFDQKQGNHINSHRSYLSPHQSDLTPRQRLCPTRSTTSITGSVVDGDQMTSTNAALCVSSQHESLGASRDCNHCAHKPQKKQHSQPHTHVYVGCHHHRSEETDNHDPFLLATETANLLERLLPLVGDTDSMKSFINNLHTLSPQRTPRNCEHQETASTCRTPTAGSDRPFSDGSRSGGNSTGSELDDDEVLAELEEAVGKTVDDILERYST